MIVSMALAAALALAFPQQSTKEMMMIDDTPPPAPVQEPASIGEATMEADGTIVLRLRAAAPNALGEAFLRYPPDDPKYKSILDHLPGLKPGDRVPVPPFK